MGTNQKLTESIYKKTAVSADSSAMAFEGLDGLNLAIILTKNFQVAYWTF